MMIREMEEDHDLGMNEMRREMSRDDLTKLLCTHERYVRIKAYIMIRHRADAEDVAQNAMISAYKSIESLREPEKIKGWLNTIVRNEAKKLFATNSRYKDLIDKLNMETGVAELAPEPEYVAAEIAFREMMRRAEVEGLAKEILDSLDSIHRTIMDMKFWDKCTFAEISDVTGINVNTLRSMYVRCRDRLYEKYKDIGKEAGLNVREKE